MKFKFTLSLLLFVFACFFSFSLFSDVFALDDAISKVKPIIIVEFKEKVILLEAVIYYDGGYGLPTVLHFAGSPVAFAANLHCAAAIPSFIALENHALDVPFWEDLVTGLPETLIEDGYVRVLEKPGLGVDLNYEEIEKHLRSPDLFGPTDEWNTPKLGFWRPS